MLGLVQSHEMNIQGKVQDSYLLSYQTKVTVTSCFVYTVIGSLESINHLCINLIRRIGLVLIHKRSIDSH